jgi:hypothetical protein
MPEQNVDRILVNLISSVNPSSLVSVTEARRTELHVRLPLSISCHREITRLPYGVSRVTMVVALTRGVP